jgi:hypothetical protein
MSFHYDIADPRLTSVNRSSNCTFKLVTIMRSILDYRRQPNLAIKQRILKDKFKHNQCSIHEPQWYHRMD